MNSAALEYKTKIDEAYSAYLDATYGFALQAKEVFEDQKEILEKRGVTSPSSKEWGELDNQPFTYEIEDKVVYRGTVRDHKHRNDASGRNWQWAAEMFVVTVYELWDSHYRAAISVEKGLKKDGAQSDSLSDLRHYRNFIIHCNSVADSESTKLKKFVWVKQGVRIRFSMGQMNEIVNSIKEELERF